MKIDIKELAVVKTQVNKSISTAQQLTIKTKEDLEGATVVLSKIKSVGKLIQQKKESITKPLNEALKNARDLFRPLEESWEEAERIVKQKMVVFQVAEEKKFEQASVKLEKIDKPETQIGNTIFKTIKKVIIKDEAKLPREYLLPNEVLIRKDALAGKEIAGVEVIEEKIVASK